MQQYHGDRGMFYHFDLYRLDDPEELFESGLNEYLGGDGLAVVEWPENAALNPESAFNVTIERDFERIDCDEPARQITITYPGEA